MDIFLLAIAILIIISFHLKSYYLYKFTVIEEFKVFNEGLFKFSFNAKHMSHKIHSFVFFPLVAKSSSEESKKAKYYSNIFLTIFYMCLFFIVGYSFLV